MILKRGYCADRFIDEHYQCSAFLGDGISQYDMKCHHHSGSVERFWWVVYISAARLNLGSGESSLSTYCSYYWTPWWFWNFLATGKKINRDLSGFWLKDSKKLNIRGISKSIRQFIRHSTTCQIWPVPVGPQVFVIAENWICWCCRFVFVKPSLSHLQASDTHQHLFWIFYVALIIFFGFS